MNHKSSFMHSRYAAAVLACIVAVAFGVAYYFCGLAYETECNAILQEQTEQFTAWVQGTNASIELWRDQLHTQAKQVTEQDTFKLFMLDAGDVATDGDASGDDKSVAVNTASYVEQIPLLRSMLYDFMNYNGFTDARLVGAKGQSVLSALARPVPLTTDQKQTIESVIANQQPAFSPIRGTTSGMVIDYVVPVTAIENRHNILGALLLTIPMTNQVTAFLGREMRQDFGRTSYLIQGNNGVYQNVDIHTAQPFAINAPRTTFVDVIPFGPRLSFGTQPHLGVYSYGHKVQHLEWWIVLEMPLDILNSRFTSLLYRVYGAGILSVFGLALVLALGWWIVIGKEQQAAAEYFKRLHALIAQQKSILDSINVSLQVGLVLVDHNGYVRVFNRSFAKMVQRDDAALQDATLLSVFDGTNSGVLLDRIRAVTTSQKNTVLEMVIPTPHGDALYRVTLYPYYPPNGQSNGAVAIFQDITEFRRAHNAAQQRHTNLVNALISAIESIDPYLTGHSKMMSELGNLIGEALGMTPAERETLRDASTFSQVGKLFVPREILTKTGKLTADELAVLKQIPEKGYSVLAGIGFDEATALAVRQMYEQLDGKGYPQGLSGDEITVYGKVLALTNAFVAMSSQRAFRDRIELVDVLERLKNDTTHFDPSLVTTLRKVLLTPAGSELLEKFYSSNTQKR
ncbi:MAG: HD domain-containing phosphohydrolase [Thermoguttaceae bacterium]